MKTTRVCTVQALSSPLQHVPTYSAVQFTYEARIVPFKKSTSQTAWTKEYALYSVRGK
jgi:hypothetical protein